MAKRSLQASAEGIRKAKHAFKRKGWTQEYLAGEVGLETRQSIWKFFTGKSIDRHVFSDICFALELEISEIAQKPEMEDSTYFQSFEHTTLDIDALVQKLRSVHHEKIQFQCSTLHLLDVARPISLSDIYIDIYILEEISSQRCLDIHELQNSSSRQSPSQQITGLEALQKYSKLIVLGKPGSGKTTFLQSVALSCNQGIFQPNYLPIFINLKNFSEDAKDACQISLFRYIHEYLMSGAIPEVELNTIFYQGRALILLDGLDEIIEKDAEKIHQIIRSFINKFYKNQIVISSRVPSHYANFHGFTEVEIADFNQQQITKFAEKWFLFVAKTSPENIQIRSQKFIQKLELAENSYILELAATPMFLHFLCLNFQSTADFRGNHCEIYKQALDLLLVRWSELKGIKRDEIYPGLSLLDQRKLYSDIATIIFAQKYNFITESKLQQIIINYLSNLPNYKSSPDSLELESLAVLKKITLQHGLLIEKARGIYSFANLIFNDYFIAKEITSKNNNTILDVLINNFQETESRKVLLLSASILKSTNRLFECIQQKIDSIVQENAKLHNFLTWVEQKSVSITSLYHCASLRAFYFTLALPPEHPLACNQDLAISLEHQFTSHLSVELALDLALNHALVVSLTMTSNIFFARLSALNLALDLKYLLPDELSLHQSLQDLKHELPNSKQCREALKIWWELNGISWTEKLRTLMINTRQLGLNWQFSPQDFQDLQQYWDANKLLMDCLKVAEDISPNLRCYLETNLFVSRQTKTSSIVPLS